MTLGMGKGKISKILIIETVLVGIISLIGGILLGIVLSQGLSIFTSKLFDVSMSEYKFIFSSKAMIKTILYFGLIFILVTILNSFTISKYKIIDLLNYSKKSEDIKIKSSIIYIFIFIIAVLCLIVAYKTIINNGLELNYKFSLSIILGIIGTVLVFFSLAGFGVNIIKKSKSIYFKDLNIFIVKQLNSKINTNFISMSVICLMLFITIVMLSTGLSFKNALEKSLEETTPFDATATMYYDSEYQNDIESTLKELNFNLDDNEKYAYYNEYIINETLSKSLDKYINENQKKELSKVDSYNIYAIKESEYNKVMELENEEKVNLNNGEILITSNNDKVIKPLNDILKENNKIDLNNKVYTIKNNKVVTVSTRTTNFADNFISIIVKDNEINNLNATLSANYLNINYNSNNRYKSEEKFDKLFKSFFNGEIKNDKVGFIIGYTKDQIYAGNKGMTTIFIFVGIYLGIVFLISSMAVLSLQQLSEASDSIDRYKSLKRIGANERMINKTIFIQTLLYFALPLVLAFIHSIVAIDVISDFISVFGNPNIATSSIITGLIFIVIYMGYFYSTYTGYKNIIKNS